MSCRLHFSPIACVAVIALGLAGSSGCATVTTDPVPDTVDSGSTGGSAGSGGTQTGGSSTGGSGGTTQDAGGSAGDSGPETGPDADASLDGDAPSDVKIDQWALEGGTTCSNAVDITASINATNSFTGVASMPGSDPGSCSKQDAPKLYMKYTVPATGNYQVNIAGVYTGNPSPETAALFVRSTCDKPDSELICNQKPLAGGTYIGVMNQGDIYIIVDGEWFSKPFYIGVYPEPGCFEDSECGKYGGGAECDYDTGVCKMTVVCSTPGTGNCDGNPDNGCEANLNTDSEACGDCYTSCLTLDGVETATCDAGTCKISACKAGFTDCNHATSDGCEITTGSDPLNCGSCGQSCNGGSCVSGVCAPPPVQVANNQLGPWLITTDANNVFWINRSDGPSIGFSVMSVAKSGGTPAVVYKATAAPRGLAVDDTGVYFTVGETVQKVAKTGGTPTVLHTKTGGSPSELAVDGTQLYWIDTVANLAYHMPKAGGTPKPYTMWGSATLGSLTLDATSVFITDAEQVSRANKDGTGMTQVLAAGLYLPDPQPTLVASDGTNVYYAESDGIGVVPKAGGTESTLFSDYGTTVNSIGLGSTDVYAALSGNEDTISRIPKGTGLTAILATIPEGISKLTVDSSKVYFTTAGGRVMSVPK